MGLLRRFEKTLERAIEAPFAKVFGGEVHPLEVARRVLREMDDARLLSVEGVQAPNRFTVLLAPDDLKRLEGVLPSLAAELESLAISYANEKGYHLPSRPRLTFRGDEALRTGEFEVEASFAEGSRGTSGEGREEPVRHPLTEETRKGAVVVLSGGLSGSRHVLERARTRIGSAQENDIVLPDPGVSRFHAEIERTRGGYVLRDLGSTNGTMVGGRRVRERLLEEGDALVFGGVEARFELVEEGPQEEERPVG